MKLKEIREMDGPSLKKKEEDFRRELNIELGAKASGGGRSQNPGKIRALRRTIARVLTIASQKARTQVSQKAEKPAKKAAKPKMEKPETAKQ